MSTRQSWITVAGEKEQGNPSKTHQCKLAGVSRASVHRKKQVCQSSALDLKMCALIDEEYTQHPFYGSRRMVVHLARHGYRVNRKRVQRLMRKMGLAGMAPGPDTSKAHPEHKVYPYLLRGVPITKPNHVWSTDITYIRLNGGFAYLVAVIDWYSRKVLIWRTANSMDTSFCIDALEEAMRLHGKPDVFNSDQGSQFTSEVFTKTLKDKQIAISMDGRGRALDNIFVERLWRSVKYEDVYLNGYATMGDLYIGLSKYFAFYNQDRPHQSLGDQTPNAVYASAQGGGALIVDKYQNRSHDNAGKEHEAGESGDARGEIPVSLRSTGISPRATSGQRCSAAMEVLPIT